MSRKDSRWRSSGQAWTTCILAIWGVRIGSWLAQAGVDIRRVSELMRHSNIRVSASVYAHLAPGNRADAVEVLDRTPKGGTVSRLGFTLPESGEEGGSSQAIID